MSGSPTCTAPVWVSVSAMGRFALQLLNAPQKFFDLFHNVVARFQIVVVQHIHILLQRDAPPAKVNRFQNLRSLYHGPLAGAPPSKVTTPPPRLRGELLLALLAWSRHQRPVFWEDGHIPAV